MCKKLDQSTGRGGYCSNWTTDGLSRAEREGRGTLMLTPSDKQVIAEYMGWFKHIYFYKYDEPIYFQEGVAGDIVFDLNDAGLAVNRMVEKGDWDDFMMVAKKCLTIHYSTEGKGWTEFIFTFVAWLFNADNFFQAMAEWLRQK